MLASYAEDFLHDRSVHVGEAEVSAGVAIGELLVIEAQEVKHRGVQVVDVDFLLDGLEAQGRRWRRGRSPPSRRRRPSTS